jgi:hypothetical protein
VTIDKGADYIVITVSRSSIHILAKPGTDAVWIEIARRNGDHDNITIAGREAREIADFIHDQLGA